MLHQRVDCTDARPTTYRPHGLGQQRKYHERLVRALLASAHRVGACLEKRIVEGPATARRRSVRGNRRRLRHGQLSSPCRSGRRFASFQRQRAPAGPPNYVFRANRTPPLVHQQSCSSTGTAVPCLWHSLTALRSCPQLALSQLSSLYCWFVWSRPHEL